jgi:hypothetical protein
MTVNYLSISCLLNCLVNYCKIRLCIVSQKGYSFFSLACYKNLDILDINNIVISNRQFVNILLFLIITQHLLNINCMLKISNLSFMF